MSTDANGRLVEVFTFDPSKSSATLVWCTIVGSPFVAVHGSTAVPNSYVLNTAAHTITVIFDGTSTPTDSDLVD